MNTGIGKLRCMYRFAVYFVDMFRRAEVNCAHGFNQIYGECRSKVSLDVGGFDEKVCSPLVDQRQSCAEKVCE